MTEPAWLGPAIALVFGFGASARLLGEKLEGWKIAATLLVMGGLAINLLWPWRVS